MRICYTYLIGWSELDKWYYGRRTAINCHPSEFWITYKTSSKIVKKFVKAHGDPDIIQIRKTFDTIEKCKYHESKVLRCMKVSKSVRWLNIREADEKWDTTGTFFATDNFGNILQVSCGDPRVLSGEVFSINKGKSHKSKHKNTVVVKDSQNKKFRVDVNNPNFLSGEYQAISKGFVPVKDKDGTIFKVSTNDPRYLSGELVHMSKGVSNEKCKNMITVRDKNTNKCFNVSNTDVRYLSGELQPVCKGIKRKNPCKRGIDKTIICPHCNTQGGERIMKRWHFDNCKSLR